MSEFHDKSSLQQTAILLLDRWGYHSYVDKSQFRAELLIIRDQVGHLFTHARKTVEKAEHEYRREFLPPPSREKPRHDPATVASAQDLERLAKAIGALQASLTHQPIPGTDKTNERYRQDATTLKALADADQRLAGQAELLRAMVEGKPAAWVIENLADLREGIDAITETLRQRQLLLLPS